MTKTEVNTLFANNVTLVFHQSPGMLF